MLKHPTLDKLHALKLTGMAAALEDQSATPDITDLSFEERLGLLVDREMTERDNRRMSSRLRRAKLRHAAILEDIDYRNSRGLDKGLVQSLASCQWVKEHLNVLITGPTGVGKTWLACALAHKACREGYTAQYVRLTRLLRELTIAKGDGQYSKLLTSLAKVDVLILDDWGLMKLSAENRRDLLEVLEDMAGAPPSPLANYPSRNGTASSVTPLWQMPSWTGSYTTPTRSICGANPCENSRQS